MLRYLNVIGFLIGSSLSAWGQSAETSESDVIAQSRTEFQVLDRQADGQLSFDEVFLDPVPPTADVAATEAYSSQREWCLEQFSRADANHDEGLNWREWIRYGMMRRQQPLSLKQEQRRVEREFLLRDRDGDRQVSLDEWMANAPEAEQRLHRRDFSVADADRDGQMVLSEFAGLPYVSYSAAFPLTDAYQSLFEKRLNSVLEVLHSMDRDQDTNVTSEEWSGESLRPILPSTLSVEFPKWDLDDNRAVTVAEATRMLEFAYAFRHPESPDDFTRKPRNVVLAVGWARGMDRDNDGKISRDEFLKLESGPFSERWRQFEFADRDGNGSVSFGEAAAGTWFDHSGRFDFLQSDTNLDGVIDQNELSHPLRDWERDVAMRLIPAFDDNHDGVLDLAEFLLTPMANPMANTWYVNRVDTDGDGFLSLEEFVPPTEYAGTPWLTCLPDEIFHKFDLDRDGRLSRREYRFSGDPSRLPIEKRDMFVWDLDGDGQVTFAEVFQDAAPQETDVPAKQQFDRQQNWMKSLFDRSDRNHNGWLDELEISRFDALRVARPHSPEQEVERVEREFALRDKDHDGALSAEEWLSGAGDLASKRRDFLMLDADQDNVLSLLEFGGSIDVTRSPHFRQFDPWTDWLSKRRASVIAAFAAADRDHDQRLTSSEWTDESWLGSLPKLAPHGLTDWDLNRDRVVDAEEIGLLLEATYGVRHPLAPDLLLRRGAGDVVDFGWVLFLDDNRDGRISRREFLTKFVGSDFEKRRQFEMGDDNADGELSFAEALATPWFYYNIRYEFRMTDKDLDGFLSPLELQTPLRESERETATRLIPAFDADGDQRLSLVEFAATPVPNVTMDWHSPRADLNGDGELNLQEFGISAYSQHPWCHPFWQRGIMEELFQRFDLNQDGSISATEYPVRIDFGKLPPLKAIQLLDQNGNGLLSLQEVFKEQRPSDPKSAAALDYEYRLLRSGEAFMSADRDEDEQLNPREYARYLVYLNSEEGADRATLSPVPLPPPTRPLETIDYVWRGFVIFDIGLLLILGLCLGYRRGNRNLKPAV